LKLNYRPIKPDKSLSVQIIKGIEEIIKENNLKLDDKLPPENEMAEAFGVSRLTVRETIQSLAGAGLLRIERGKGVFISKNPEKAFAAQINWLLESEEEAIAQSLEARKLIEMSVTRLAAERAIPSDIEELEELIEANRVEVNDRYKMIELGLQFHYKIYDIARNKVLNLMLRPLESFVRKKIQKLELIESVEETYKRNYEDHKEILEAIKYGDPDLAEKVAMEHLQELEKQVNKLKSNDEV